MRYGVSTWLWETDASTDRIVELVNHAADMGFDHVEMPLYEPGAFDYDRVGDAIDSRGLGASVVPVMSEGRDLVSPDATVREETVDYLRRCIEAVSAVGGATLAGDIYSQNGRTWQMTAEEREQMLDRLEENLRPLAGYAADRGVVLCVEPINRYATSCFNTTAQGIELVDRIDHPACKLTLDTFQMNIEDPGFGVAIRNAGNRIGHVHAIANDRSAPGNGHLPWTEIEAALRDVDYAETLVIESFVPDAGYGVWRPLAPTQDDLAREGLSFLRELFE